MAEALLAVVYVRGIVRLCDNCKSLLPMRIEYFEAPNRLSPDDILVRFHCDACNTTYIWPYRLPSGRVEAYYRYYMEDRL